MKKLPLSQGLFTIVDDEDYKELSKFKWYAAKSRNKFYAQRRNYETNQTIYMHRIILKIVNKKILVDHKNGDGLDNRKENLRSCTNSQNIRNSKGRKGTSKYKGVSWEKSANKWRPRLYVNGRNISLGVFVSEKEAAKAYDKAALIHYAEFAKLNFS